MASLCVLHVTRSRVRSRARTAVRGGVRKCVCACAQERSARAPRERKEERAREREREARATFHHPQKAPGDFLGGGGKLVMKRHDEGPRGGFIWGTCALDFGQRGVDQKRISDGFWTSRSADDFSAVHVASDLVVRDVQLRSQAWE